MTPELKVRVFSHFNHEEAYECYMKWEGNRRKSSFEIALDKTLPAIGLMINILNSDRSLDIDELSEVAINRVVEVMKRRTFRGEHPVAYKNFILTVCKRSMLNAIYNIPAHDFKYACEVVPYGRITTTKDSNRRIFLEQLPGLIYKVVVSRIRFSSSNKRRACFHVLRRLLTGRNIVPELVRREFNLGSEDTSLVIDYVCVLCRDVIYGLRRSLGDSVVSDEWHDFMDLAVPQYSSHEDLGTQD